MRSTVLLKMALAFFCVGLPSLNLAQAETLFERCVSYLTTSASASYQGGQLTTLQKNTIDYIQEVKRKRDFTPGPFWQQRIVLKSVYVKETLISLSKAIGGRLTPRQKRSFDKRAITSGEILKNYTDLLLQNFDEKGITYGQFLNLSNVYAHNFALLSSDKKIREFALEKQEADAYVWHFGIPLLRFSSSSKLLPSTEHLKNLINRRTMVQDVGIGGLHFRSGASRFTRLGVPFVLIPTTANVGFDTILLAQSFGAGFVGLSTEAMIVDGEKMEPVRFFFHDLRHNEIIAKGQRADSKIWEKLRSKIITSTEDNQRERKLKQAILFFLFHEQIEFLREIDMNCDGLKLWFKDEATEVKNANAYFMLIGASTRLNRADDLGQAFGNEFPKLDEIFNSYFEIGQMVKEICR